MRLLIVGTGPERERLMAQVATHGLSEYCEWTGAVDPYNVPGLLTSMDVGVVPCAKMEGYYFSPLKVYEYLASGLPVVAARIGQLETLIEHGVNGLLFTAGDASELAALLTRLQCDTALRARMGRAARQTVLQDCTWRAASRRILQLAGFDRVAQWGAISESL